MDFGRILLAQRPVILPVIHVLTADQAVENLRHVEALGGAGAFLINHDFGVAPFLPILRDIRAACPQMWLGVNFLAQTGAVAFPILADLARQGSPFQAYWADDARIEERTATEGADPAQPEAEEIARIRAESGWHGLYLGGVAFKKQRPVARSDESRAATLARAYMDVVTTSGPATGQEADVDKTRRFRAALGTAPLALASGITPENVARYADHVDLMLVATGINRPGDFYNIDPARLHALQDALATGGTRG